MRTRRTFGRELKLQILKEVESRPVSEVCREHDLLPTVVSRWRRELQDYPSNAFKGKGHLFKLEAQLAERDRLIGQLYAENALLKKARELEAKRKAEERMLRSTP